MQGGPPPGGMPYPPMPFPPPGGVPPPMQPPYNTMSPEELLEEKVCEQSLRAIIHDALMVVEELGVGWLVGYHSIQARNVV